MARTHIVERVVVVYQHRIVADQEGAEEGGEQAESEKEENARVGAASSRCNADDARYDGDQTEQIGCVAPGPVVEFFGPSRKLTAESDGPQQTVVFGRCIVYVVHIV